MVKVRPEKAKQVINWNEKILHLELEMHVPATKYSIYTMCYCLFFSFTRYVEGIQHSFFLIKIEKQSSLADEEVGFFQLRMLRFLQVIGC